MTASNIYQKRFYIFQTDFHERIKSMCEEFISHTLSTNIIDSNVDRYKHINTYTKTHTNRHTYSTRRYGKRKEDKQKGERDGRRVRHFSIIWLLSAIIHIGLYIFKGFESVWNSRPRLKSQAASVLLRNCTILVIVQLCLWDRLMPRTESACADEAIFSPKISIHNIYHCLGTH